MELERSISITTDGQCTSMAELGDEGNELYAFVGVDKNLVVSCLSSNKNRAQTIYSSQRILRSNSQINSCFGFPSQRVIRAHFQVLMSTAYRRDHQQVKFIIIIVDFFNESRIQQKMFLFF
jgi:hypothetical protein